MTVGNIGDAAVKSGDLVRRMTELERLVRELMGGRRLENSTIGGGGLRVASHGVIRSETFDGNLPLGDAGDNGWALGNDRLSIRGQFVGPFDFAGIGLSSTGFTVTTTIADRVSGTVDVPAWADEAMILLTATCTIHNGSAGFNYANIRATIDGTGGGSNFKGFAIGEYACMVATAQRLITNPASTVPVAGQVWNQGAANFGTDGTNIVTIDGHALFRRVD